MAKMPSVSLAKPGEIGSKEWLRDQVLKHGSTHSDNLEKRRKALSFSVAQQQATVKQIQDMKKLLSSAYKEEMARVEKNESDKDKAQAMKQALERRLKHEIIQYDIAITQISSQSSLLDAILLLVDNSSIRCKIEDTSTGKIVGHTRFSSAYYQEQASLGIMYVVALLKPIVDRLIKDKHFKEMHYDVKEPEERMERRQKMVSEKLVSIVDYEETSDLLETDDPHDILTPDEEKEMEAQANKHRQGEEEL